MKLFSIYASKQRKYRKEGDFGRVLRKPNKAINRQAPAELFRNRFRHNGRPTGMSKIGGISDPSAGCVTWTLRMPLPVSDRHKTLTGANQNPKVFVFRDTRARKR